MKRSTWAALLLLGAAGGLVAYLVLGRGLPAYARSDAEAASKRLEELAGALKREEQALDALLGEEPAFLKDRPEVAAAREELTARRQKLEALRAAYAKEVKPLLEKDAYGDAGDLMARLARINADLGELHKAPAAAVERVRKILDYKKNHAELVAAARQAVSGATGLADDPVLTSGLRESIDRYPEARAALEKKMAALRADLERLNTDAPRLEALVAATPVDYVAVGTLADALVAAGKRARATRAALLSDFAELRRSVDKILVDMKEEGSPPRYYHQYKFIEDGVARDSGWVAVTEATYRAHVDHLGMTIYSKPEGVLEEDAITVASPPGFAYVGNPRYGRWEGTGNDRFWVFYGQYAMLRDLFWGPGFYTPVTYLEFDDWDDHRRKRKVYYGRQRQYGTRGTFTRRRYAGSTFLVRRASRSSSTSYRSGGSYRGSRYRGSSFGGGGK